MQHNCRRCGAEFALPPCRRPKFCSFQCKYDADAEAAWDSYVEQIRDVVHAGDPLACIEWPGRRDRDGYGIVGNSRRHGLVRASRLSFEIFAGSSPGEASVLHTCDNPPCCNPNHLFLGDNIANMADRQRKGRTLSRERHGMSKLTADQVGMVRGSGRATRDLAGEFGVSIRQINNIKAGRAWRVSL